MNDGMGEARPTQRRKRKRIAWVVFVIGLGLCVLLNCSGMIFPILSAKRDLRSRLQRSLSIELPPSARIERAARVALLDPLRFYLVNLSASDHDTLQARVQSRGQETTLETKDMQGFTGGPRPDWWHPELLPKPTRYFHIDTSEGSGDQSFHFIFSNSDDHVYIWWVEY